MLLIILLVCFVVVMLLWFLSMVVGLPDGAGGRYSPWLAFLACLILGLVVFLAGSGVIVIDRPVLAR